MSWLTPIILNQWSGFIGPVGEIVNPNGNFGIKFVKLIVIGFVIAAPLSWYVMNQWLNSFTYKIEMGPSIFIIGLASTFAIAMLTVGYRSFKAAVANPAHSLRSE